MREQRKVVTVLFADVVGSTAFADAGDPEVVRGRMARHFQRIAEVSEAHGGTVEKFAGDAAMVVFGVPAVHDDDAERAVRAALEIRDGATELPVRVGVNTGEAVTAARDDRQFMLAERGALEEASPLFDECENWAYEQKIHLWDPEIDEVRSLIAAKRDA